MKCIIAVKKGMTSVYQGEKAVAVTVVQVLPQTVVQLKKRAKEGYDAVQIGAGQKRKGKKPQVGEAKKVGQEKAFAVLREFRTKGEGYSVGQKLSAAMFVPGDMVAVQGKTKGRGFQGVVKRHGFAGHPATHGHKDQLRMPGSIGNTDPGHVFPGRRMGGHMGDERLTVRNLEIIDVQPEHDALLIAGAVPGSTGGTVFIMGKGKPPKAEVAAEGPIVEKTEEVKAETVVEATPAAA